MFDVFRKRLGYKIMLVIIIVIIVSLVTEIYMRIYYGTRDRFEIATSITKELADSIYAGIKSPMATGDKQSIRRQLQIIRDKAKDVEVFVCAYDQETTYSSHDEIIPKKVGDLIGDATTRRVLSSMLETGIPPAYKPGKPFEDRVDGRKYLVTMRPILNEADCHHCHGASRNVLGALVIRFDAEKLYAQVTAQRNRTVLISVIVIPIAAIFVYFIVNILVRRPVEELAEQAKKFAEGNMSVQVSVKTEDEIGILGRTFNYMVESVASFSKRLEEEVRRKTALLNERTRLMSLLERANKDLRELDKLKSTFLANMSHELRTPMNAIIGYTDLLIDGVDGPVNEDQKKSLNKVATNARHLLQLINDVLDISKIEAGKMKINPKEFDLKWLITAATPAFEPQMKSKGLQLTVDIPDGLPLVYADEDRVKEILINLLSNAIKFTQKGGIVITARISERGIKPGEPPIFMEICVEDTGIGIKEDDIGKIFDKFVQADLTTVRQYEGTGLGLSIARGLVSLHKGIIWVTSKFGEGSKFCFTLPIKKEILDKAAEPVIEPQIAEALADYFGKPVDLFLRPPAFAGKPLRCWEYIRCGQPSCPAYGSNEPRCWLVMGTHCTGMKIAAYPEKVDFCKGCELIKSIATEARDEYPAEQILPTKKDTKIILAIDDNPEAIDIICKYLGEDYTVVGLLGGDDAVEKAKQIKPMAITLDIMMPRKDGWEVLRELKNDPETQDIPVIVLSIVDDQRMGFSLGAAEYIVKPVEKELLLKKLKTLEKAEKFKRILIVDNEPTTVRMMGRVLEEAEYQVTTAYNSQDAVKSIENFKPDLIVLNLTVPEIGFDVIEYLKAARGMKDIPLIVLTQKELSDAEREQLNGRIRGILNKVILSKEDLLKELKNTIQKMSRS